MSLILATGSNLFNKKKNLEKAKLALNKYFDFICESQIYWSEPVDYLQQDNFLNQVLEYQIPQDLSPLEALKIIKTIEKKFGRKKLIPKGPRIIDIDIIFWAGLKLKTDTLTIPHPSWSERSFIVKPLEELPYYHTLKDMFSFPKNFSSQAVPMYK